MLWSHKNKDIMIVPYSSLKARRSKEQVVGGIGRDQRIGRSLWDRERGKEFLEEPRQRLEMVQEHFLLGRSKPLCGTDKCWEVSRNFWQRLERNLRSVAVETR